MNREIILEKLPKKIIWVPNPGNAGDDIIALGIYHFFTENNIDFELGDPKISYKNKFLVYSGGGNLIPLYPACKNFLLRNSEENKILILPHSIYGVDDVLKTPSVIENVLFFCREMGSYNYVKKFTNNVWADHDMAFSISNQFISKHIKNSVGVLNCFRQDAEKTNIKIPNDNQDISSLLNKDASKSNIKTIEFVANDFFSKISDYSTVNTNRLHVGIVASMLNKEVSLHANSYYKSEMIYKYSLKDCYPRTKFFDNVE